MEKLFSEQYINFNLIHENHKSRIYRAISKKNNQSVIIKSMNLQYPSEKDIRLFSNGYHIINQLNKPNLIKVYDLKLGHKQAAFVMEDIGGVSLDKYLTSPYLTVDEIIDISIQLILNLKHIHDELFIHMDINPSNIIWNSETGNVKIIDFEMAASQMEILNYSKEKQSINGSLAYISPEQTGRLNIPIDYRSDYYSLGASLYELLTHSKPFISDDYQDYIHCHIAMIPQYPTDLNPDIPEVLSDIVLKLMAKMPEDRYQSHVGLKHDLVKCQKALYKCGKIHNFPMGTNDIPENFTISKKLYGRSKNITTINNLIETYNKNKSLIFITGEEGSGKTSLMRKINNFIFETKRIHIRGNCLKNFQDTPYYVWISAINNLIDQWLSQSKQILDRIKSFILMDIESNGSVLTNLIPRLELIIGHQKQTFISGFIENHNLFNSVFCKFLKAISQEKELIILFDDIQWMDSASKKLLMTILQYKALSNCTILLTSINNQFHQVLSDLTASGKLPYLSLHHMKIDNISVQDISDLLYDSFRFSPDLCQKCSKLLHSKTRGNVSFLHQILVKLHSEGLIQFDKGASQWLVNLKKIRPYEIADNLVTVSINRYKQLSIESRSILEQASCLGYTVDKKILAHLLKLSESELNKLLVEPVKYAVIILDDLLFHFSHNQIQQAIYDLIPHEKRYYIHRDIAQFIYNNFKKKKDKQKLFEIIFHYNKAISVLQKEDIRLLINLNIDAGVCAINKRAYDTAVQYLTNAISIANDISYDFDRQTIETIYENRAKAYILLSEFNKAEQDIDGFLLNTKCLKKKGRFSELALMVYAMTGQFEKGLQFGLTYLRDAGLDIPDELTSHYKNQLIKETNSILEKDKGDLLFKLPWMTDETMQYASIILFRLIPFLYFSKPEFIFICPCLSIHLFQKYGQYKNTPVSLALYAAYLCHPDIANFSLGFEIAEKTEYICDQIMNKESLIFVLKVRYGAVSCWQMSPYHCMERIKEVVRICLDIGDHEMASYCHLYHAIYLFSAGNMLDDAIKICTDIVDHLKMLGHEEVISLSQQMLEMIVHFSRRSNEIDKLHKFNDTTNETIYKKSIISLVLHFYYHRYIDACNYAKQAMKNYNDLNVLTHATLWLAFYGALSYLSLKKEQRYDDDEMLKCIDLIEIYYTKLPGLIDNKYYLIKAMELSLKNEYNTAIDCFEKAILISRQKKLIQDEALAHELAFEFLFSQGGTNTAALYFGAAIKLYKKWGAHGIAQFIKDRYPQFNEEKKQSYTDTFSVLDISDFKTIREANKIINQQTAPEKSFYNIINLLVKISGAQKGILFLRQNCIWKIVESIEIHLNTNGNKKCFKEKNSDDYPETIINYVSNSKKHFILSNQSDNNFLQNPYIIKYNVKSLICIPLMTREHICAIVYLENKFVPDLFSKKVYEVLDLVAAQFALLIENQIIKKELESKRSDPNKSNPHYCFKNDVTTHSSNQILDNLSESHYNYYNEIIKPQLNLLKERDIPVKLRKKIVKQIEHEMKNISDAFITKIEHFKLSTTEKKIVFLLKQNFVSKEIADILNVSIDTINTHRKNIRKKLMLTNKNKNLVMFIKSMENDL